MNGHTGIALDPVAAPVSAVFDVPAACGPVEAECRPQTASRPLLRRGRGDILSTVAVGGLFLALAFRLAQDFARTGRLTGLLLLLSELLVVVLLVLRRPATTVDRSWTGRLITAVALAGPPFFRPSPVGGLVPDLLTASLLACGLAISLGGKLSLGRSFGLVPANRGIVSSGLYRVVRHPIYFGYVVAHAAFLLAHPTAWNLVVLVASDCSLLLRSACEERTLALDPEYEEYRQRVRWRIVPGLL
jgi:protein-S-isoprenylcysteine O-methyltransferase Ste14